MSSTTSPETAASASDSAGIPPDQKEEYERMEKWLDDHPEFVHDYFARKAKRSMVDGWLIAHALSHSGLSLQTDSLSTSSGSNSKPSSGANTPVRKISAQEFDKGGLLKPIVSTVDGLPTFLEPVPPPTSSQPPKTHRRSRSELKALDEKELMYELVIDICNDLDVRSLCYKILQNLCILLTADRCSLFLVQGRGTNEKWLVSQLFDVSSDSHFEDVTSADKEEIRIPFGTGIIGYVGQTGEVVNIPDAYEDPRFNREIDLRMGYKTRSILCMPIKDSEGEVIGVAQAINKITAIVEPFNEHDEKIFASYLAFCGIGVKNAQMYERSLLENRRNQVLLDLARVIFEEQTNVASLIHKIMMHTQSLLQCQRCQVLLVEDITKDKNRRSSAPYDGLFSQVFDLQASDFDNDDTYNREGPQQPRFPINVGVTGYVAATGETLNIPDAYEDPRFDPAVDSEDFRTRSLLCIPIKNAAGKVIGVTQLVNKLDGTPFTKNDENLLEAFSIFSGLGIQNTQMYETACKAMAKQRIALETLSYHATAPPEEAQRLRKLNVPTAQQFGLLNYTFDDFQLDDDDTLRATIRMFLDLDLMEKFRISYDVFCRWILSVKKNYRNVTYHNWRHAFNVTQTMFCMLKSDDLRNMMSEPEQLALMVGCLCHDLDHRGTTNQFQIKTMSALSQLYSTSTMEHHHFDQCIMILSTKGNEIFCNLSQAQYQEVIQLLENAILSTDLALYFRFRGQFFDLVKSRRTDWGNDKHRELLRSMMMTASDVAAITKPWEVQQKVAELVASEFFEQGDIERDELKLKPMAMMDRTQKDKLPDMQVEFIDKICMPVYEAISEVFPKLDPLRDGCASNREHWQEISDLRSKQNTDMACPEITDKDRPDSAGRGGQTNPSSRKDRPQSPGSSKAKEEGKEEGGSGPRTLGSAKDGGEGGEKCAAARGSGENGGGKSSPGGPGEEELS